MIATFCFDSVADALAEATCSSATARPTRKHCKRCAAAGKAPTTNLNCHTTSHREGPYHRPWSTVICVVLMLLAPLLVYSQVQKSTIGITPIPEDSCAVTFNSMTPFMEEDEVVARDFANASASIDPSFTLHRRIPIHQYAHQV